jgi:hypothetical protein
MPKTQRKDPLAAAREREAKRAAEETEIQAGARAQRKGEKLKRVISGIEAARRQMARDIPRGIHSKGAPLTETTRAKMAATKRRLAAEKRAKKKRGR